MRLGARGAGLLALCTATAFLAVLARTAQAQTDVSAVRAQLVATISARMASDQVAGVVVVLIEGGSPVWTKAFGMAGDRVGYAVGPTGVQCGWQKQGGWTSMRPSTIA